MPTSRDHRCVGWLIRFIHNRDLAAENIATALARASALYSIPETVAHSMRARMDAVGAVPGQRSVMRSVKDIMAATGPATGMRLVHLRQSRRNTVQRVLSESLAAVLQALRYVPLPLPDTVHVMKAGVYINGRAWRRGDYASCRKNGVGSIYKVSSFHALPCVPGQQPTVFVRVYAQDMVREIVQGLYELRAREDRNDGRGAQYIDVDTIHAKIYRCSHWSDATMWVGLEIFHTV